jgi:hypothetical protein
LSNGLSFPRACRCEGAPREPAGRDTRQGLVVLPRRPAEPGDEIERQGGDGTRARVIGVVDPYGLDAGAVITVTPLTEAP